MSDSVTSSPSPWGQAPQTDRPLPTAGRERLPVVLGVGLMVLVIAIALVIASQVGAAVPEVQLASVFSAQVERGVMRIEARGTGTLAPEQIRIVPSVVPGRIDRRPVAAGDVVTAGTVLMTLSNPDVDIDYLNALRTQRSLENEYESERASLTNRRLEQASAVAAVRSEHSQALRRVRALRDIASSGSVAASEVADAEDRARQLSDQLRFEEERLTTSTGSFTTQLEALARQVRAAEAITALQMQRRASLTVVAGIDGVVQELPVEEGAWVTPGTVLAKLAGADRLKAVLRVPEQDAKEITLGLSAVVVVGSDTLRGLVRRIDAAVQDGSVAVDVAFDAPLPRGLRPDLRVDGTIQIAVVEDALHVRRVTTAQAGGQVGVYRISGNYADLVSVRIGQLSANNMEIREGLEMGDRIIVSDLREQRGSARLRLR